MWLGLKGSKFLLACFRHSGNAISHGHRNRRVSLWVSFAGDSVKIYARLSFKVTYFYNGLITFFCVGVLAYDRISRILWG